MQSIDRRDFLGRLAAVAVPAAFISRASRARVNPRLVVTHCRHMEEVIDRVRDGIDLGVEEAQRSAEMFGGTVTSRFLSFGGSPIWGQPEPPPPPIESAGDAIHVVIPGILSENLWKHTIATAKNAGAIVFNANSWMKEPYLTCERHVFHIRPSPESLETIRKSAPADARGRVELWAPTLSRFGADTLNKRARRGAMDSSAWAGWFAVKCAWEAILHSKATSTEQVVGYLEKSSTRFDGHKGAPLYFDAGHQLVQPTYLVDDGEVREELAPLTSNRAVQCR